MVRFDQAFDVPAAVLPGMCGLALEKCLQRNQKFTRDRQIVRFAGVLEGREYLVGKPPAELAMSGKIGAAGHWRPLMPIDVLIRNAGASERVPKVGNFGGWQGWLLRLGCFSENPAAAWRAAAMGLSYRKGVAGRAS